MDKLLIIGVDSIAGCNLAVALSARFDIVGLSQRPSTRLEGCRVLPADLADPVEVDGRIVEIAPQWIVHAGACSQSAWDSPTSDESVAGDSLIIATIVPSSRRIGARLTLVSTDATFHGPRLFHDESSPPADALAFSEAVLNAERLAVDGGAFVARTHVFGWDSAGKPQGIAHRIHGALDRGESIELDHDRHASPILASDLAEILCRAYRQELTGLYHVGGAERTSPYRFGIELAAACGFDPAAILAAASAPSAGRPAARRETSLNSARIRRDLRMAMPLVREGLARFAAEAHNGFRDRVAAGRSMRLEHAA